MNIFNYLKKFDSLWETHYLKVSFLLSFFVVLFLLSFMPYVNLVFTLSVNLFIIIILFTQIFKLSKAAIFKTCILLLIIAGMLQAIGLTVVIEQIGEWIYFATLYGLGMMVVSLKRRNI